MKRFIFTLLFLSVSFFSKAQNLTSEEQKLYNLIMEYRKSLGLPKIPLSKSLTFVAQTHTKDLVENKPDLGNCNAHSWYANGNWTSCCYTPDHAQAKCMWNKPKELTNYTDIGFEIACGSNVCCSDFKMTAEYAFNSWLKSPSHHAVMINKNAWKTYNWKAIGIGIKGGFSTVWFGKKEDIN